MTFNTAFRNSVHQTNGFLWIAHKINPNVQNNTSIPILSMVAWYVYLHECLIFIGFHAGIFPQIPQLHHLSGRHRFQHVKPSRTMTHPSKQGFQKQRILRSKRKKQNHPGPLPSMGRRMVYLPTTWMVVSFFLVVNVGKYTNPMDGMDQQNLDFFVKWVSVSVLNLFTPCGKSFWRGHSVV